MFVSVGFCALMIYLTGRVDPYGPWAEWIYTYLVVNYFAMLSYDNDFYDCVQIYSDKS